MLKTASLTNSSKIGALDTEGNLDINTLKAAISENKIDESKNAAFLNQYYQRAKQLSVEKANNELATKLYRGTLSNTSLSEVGGKFGLTVEENPEFFNIEEPTEKFEKLRTQPRCTIPHSMTASQSSSKNIAETFDSPLRTSSIKDIADCSEQNWQKHLDTLGRRCRRLVSEDQ